MYPEDLREKDRVCPQVDHYNYINKDTFSQRVVMSKKYLNEDDPPILFYTGNEGDIFAFVNNVNKF